MKKSNIFEDDEELVCARCGKDLMESVGESMVQIIHDADNRITKIRPCCKGKCDKLLLHDLKHGENDGWKELHDFTNPYLYLQHIMAVFNSMYEGNGFANKEAFEAYKDLIIKCYPYVVRNITENEIECANISKMFPF